MRVNSLHSQVLTSVVARCIFFLLVLVITLQCTFDPDEEYFKTVAQPELTPTIISFFSIPDTTDFRGNIDLYLTSSNQQEIIRHKLTLNDAVLSEQPMAPSHITINSRNFPDGIYDLKLKMTKRVTGESIASKLGEEHVEVELTKKVIIFNAPIPKPEMFTSIEDGVLILHWKTYTGRRFTKYVIRGATIDNDITITDPRQNSMPLDDFVGGMAFFTMQVHAYTERSEEYKLFDYPLNVSITKTPQGLHLSWHESPFVNYNGAEIEIRISQQYTRINLDKTQRSFAYDLPWTFPHKVSAAVRAVSKRNVGFWIGGKLFTTQFLLGNFDNGLDIFKTTRDSVYIILKESIGSATHTKGFTHVNVNNGNSIKSKRGFAGISPNGLLLYELRDKTTLMRIDPNTLEYTESFDVSSFVSNINTVHSVFVSNGNIVVLYIEHKYTDRPTENWYYAIDCNTKQLIFSATITNSANALDSRGTLSHDGRTFYRYDKLIRIDQTPISTRWFDYGSPYLETALSQRGEAVFWRLDYLVEKQLNSPNTSVSIPYPKKVLKIFSSGDNSVIGVAYTENNLIKFDFLEAGTLNMLATLQTTLTKVSWSSYTVKIVDRSLYLYIQYEGTFHKFDF
jgi:hypothetical protein